MICVIYGISIGANSKKANLKNPYSKKAKYKKAN